MFFFFNLLLCTPSSNLWAVDIVTLRNVINQNLVTNLWPCLFICNQPSTRNVIWFLILNYFLSPMLVLCFSSNGLWFSDEHLGDIIEKTVIILTCHFILYLMFFSAKEKTKQKPLFLESIMMCLYHDSK